MSQMFAETAVPQSGVEWWTPTTVLDAVRASMGGIDLDPASCAEANEAVGATQFYSIADDGLASPWAGRLWLNPPFSGCSRWAAKLLDEIAMGNIEAACFLGPIGSGPWVARMWETADAVVWLHALTEICGARWRGPSAAAAKDKRPWRWGLMLAMWGGDPARLARLGRVR